jgi:hypothetical protein
MRPYQSEVVIQDDEKRGVDVVLEPIPVAAPPPEVHGPLYDMELGFRTGYGVAKRSARGSGDTNFQSKNVGFIPLWFDLGYRLGRPTYLGLYAQYGWLDKSDTCGIARHGAEPLNATDTAIRYGYTSCKFLKAGIDVVFHLMPRTLVDPYFGFDVGVQGTFARYHSYDPTRTDNDHDGNDNNASIQPGFQLGIDVHPVKTLGVGLFAHGGPDIGSEGKPNDQQNGSSCAPGTGPGMPQGCQPINSCQQSSCNSDANDGVHILFGTRIAYTFP